jgi:large conductance mechanosensitive channel
MNNQVANSAGMAKEFIDFLKKFGVIGLAIGVVVGGAVKTLVDGLVTMIVSPVIGKIITLIVGGKGTSVTDFGITGLDIGGFIGSIINFVVLMWIVFVAVKIILSKFLSKEELEAMKM